MGLGQYLTNGYGFEKSGEKQWDNPPTPRLPINPNPRLGGGFEFGRQNMDTYGESYKNYLRSQGLEIRDGMILPIKPNMNPNQYQGGGYGENSYYRPPSQQPSPRMGIFKQAFDDDDGDNPYSGGLGQYLGRFFGGY